MRRSFTPHRDTTWRTLRISQGDPGPTICDMAAEVKADVIVVGNHGAGFVARLLAGSVSTYVVHHAPCAVLVVRQPKDSSSD